MLKLVEDQIFVERHKTSAVKLVELNYDLVGYSEKLLKFDAAQVKDCIVKVTVKCTEAQREAIDFEAFRLSIEQHAKHVRQIHPIVVREEGHQPVRFKTGLTDQQMIEAWLAERKPPNAEMVGQCALKVLDER